MRRLQIGKFHQVDPPSFCVCLGLLLWDRSAILTRFEGTVTRCLGKGKGGQMVAGGTTGERCLASPMGSSFCPALATWHHAGLQSFPLTTIQRAMPFLSSRTISLALLFSSGVPCYGVVVCQRMLIGTWRLALSCVGFPIQTWKGCSEMCPKDACKMGLAGSHSGSSLLGRSEMHGSEAA